jgi:hypothetical protein
MRPDLFAAYCEMWFGIPLDQFEPIPISPQRAQEIFWRLNPVFKTRAETLGAMPYKKEFERAADEAIIAYVAKPNRDTWKDLPVEVWRVLYERQIQIITTATLNMAAGNPVFTYLPKGLFEAAELPALMLSLLLEMELPFPASGTQRSGAG